MGKWLKIKVSVILDKKMVYHGGKDLTKDVIEKAKKQAEETLKNVKKESKPASK